MEAVNGGPGSQTAGLLVELTEQRRVHQEVRRFAAEAATFRAAQSSVGAGQSSVGTRIRFDHLRATPLCGRVTATAELVHEDGRLLRFSVAAHDADGRLVGEGEITRVVVDVERFLGKL